MKTILLILTTFTSLLYFSNSAQALGLGLPSANQARQLLLCDSKLQNITARCEDFTPQKLIQIASLDLETPHNPECEANPNDPSCGFNHVTIQSKEFVVISATTAKVEHWRVSKKLSRYSIQSIKPSNNLINLATNFNKLNDIFINLGNKYRFTEQDDGRFTNMYGESINELVMGSSSLARPNYYYSANSNDFNFGQTCKSALDYVNARECQSGVNKWLQAMDKKFNKGSNWPDVLDSITAGLNAGALSVGVTFKRSDLKIKYVTKFRNGSLLIINVTPDPDIPGAPIIELNEEQSATSDGISIAQFEKNINKGIEQKLTGSELQALFNNSHCRHLRVQIGVEKEYLVTKNSKGEIVSVQLFNQTPIIDTRLVCSPL